MIDFSQQIAELEECKQEFDTFGQRLFDLSLTVTEEEFSTQEMFAISAQIIYVRKRIADIIVGIKDVLDSEGDYLELEESDDTMDTIQEAFTRDDDLLPTLVEEVAVFRRNNLALSAIARYQDVLLSVVEYCRTGDKKHLQKKFRDISVEDIRS